MKARHAFAGHRLARTALASWLAALCCSCGGDDTEPEPDGIACPAMIGARDPALTIVDAKSSRTGLPIANLTLSGITLQGLPTPVELIDKRTGMAAEGSTLRCSVPCGMGNSPASYSMTIAAVGYKPAVFTFTAKYQGTIGACPPQYVDGTKVSIVLDPE